MPRIGINFQNHFQYF